MRRVDTVIVGAGQAGLALSRSLAAADHDHVVLERGRVAERWRSERWDSFRLLTPNWQTRLPGFRYRGDDPEGFMTGGEVVTFFDRYAASFAVPLRTGVAVDRVSPAGGRWRVMTSSGTYDARHVVIATGHYALPRTPAFAPRLPASVGQVHARDYRNPDALPAGGVLVVGAGPTGQQIADELARAGRQVFLAAGQHRPLPRRYRGRDVFWWMEHMGTLHRTVDTLDAPETAARAPGAVLTAGSEDLHLRRVADAGVVVLGHLVAADGGRLRFAADLPDTLAAADAHSARFRTQVDAWVDRTGLAVPAQPWTRPSLPSWTTTAPTSLELASEGVTTVVWATGYRRDFGWIDAPVLDARGEPVQDRGITAAPGLMFLGLRFMYRRNSNFIDGVGADAAHLACYITGIAGSARSAQSQDDEFEVA